MNAPLLPHIGERLIVRPPIINPHFGTGPTTPSTDPMPFFFDPLTPFCADLIVADFPWKFALHSPKGEGKSAQGHYACMDAAAIRAAPVALLAGRDCWLFHWVTAPLLDLGIECLKGWGFTYKTFIVWRKITKNGRPAVGTGYIARGMAELLLIGCLGEPHYSKPLDGLFDGVRREHSRKPDEFYERVERFAPHARRVDLFGRQSRPGWAVWGNEATRFDPPSSVTIADFRPETPARAEVPA